MIFSVEQFQYIGSLQLLNSSLDNLVRSFKKEDFKITSRGLTENAPAVPGEYGLAAPAEYKLK